MAPQTNSSVTGSRWLVFGTAVASSSHCHPVHQHLINVSRQCCRIVIFIVLYLSSLEMLMMYFYIDNINMYSMYMYFRTLEDYTLCIICLHNKCVPCVGGRIFPLKGQAVYLNLDSWKVQFE